MYLAIIGLLATRDAAGRLDKHTLISVLWACSTCADRIEHVAVRTEPGRADVGLYVRADTEADGYRAAYGFLLNAVDSAPALRGWRVVPPHRPGV